MTRQLRMGWGQAKEGFLLNPSTLTLRRAVAMWALACHRSGGKVPAALLIPVLQFL